HSWPPAPRSGPTTSPTSPTPIPTPPGATDHLTPLPSSVAVATARVSSPAAPPRRRRPISTTSSPSTTPTPRAAATPPATISAASAAPTIASRPRGYGPTFAGPTAATPGSTDRTTPRATPPPVWSPNPPARSPTTPHPCTPRPADASRKPRRTAVPAGTGRPPRGTAPTSGTDGTPSIADYATAPGTAGPTPRRLCGRSAVRFRTRSHRSEPEIHCAQHIRGLSSTRGRRRIDATRPFLPRGVRKVCRHGHDQQHLHLLPRQRLRGVPLLPGALRRRARGADLRRDALPGGIPVHPAARRGRARHAHRPWPVAGRRRRHGRGPAAADERRVLVPAHVQHRGRGPRLHRHGRRCGRPDRDAVRAGPVGGDVRAGHRQVRRPLGRQRARRAGLSRARTPPSPAPRPGPLVNVLLWRSTEQVPSSRAVRRESAPPWSVSWPHRAPRSSSPTSTPTRARPWPRRSTACSSPST